jgi:YVTN family beta-propeller protein
VISRAIVAALLFIAAAASPPRAEDLYIPNQGSDTLSIVNARDLTNQVTRSIGRQPHEAAATLDGHYVFISNRLDNTLSVFDTATRSEIDTDGQPLNGLTRIAVGNEPHGLAVTPDNRHLLVTHDGSNDLWILDVATFQVLAIVPEAGNGPHMVAVHPAGAEAWLGNVDGGDVSIVDLGKALTDPAQAVVCAIPGGSGAACRIATGPGTEGLAFTRDGRTAYVAGGDSDTVSVIDVRTRAIVRALQSAGGPRRVYVRPDGDRAYVSQLFGGEIQVIDTATGLLVPSETIASVSNGLGMECDAEQSRLFVGQFFTSNALALHLPDTSVRDTIPVGSSPDGVIVVPEEVIGTGFPSPGILSWARQYLADGYHVYRRLQANGPDGWTCLRVVPDGTKTGILEPQVPPLGQAFQYVVAIREETREGTLGRTSAGYRRTASLPCAD